MATGTFNMPGIPIRSEVPNISVFYNIGVNLMLIDFEVSSSLTYRLALGINTNKEMFLEKRQNGTVTRVWTAAVS